jgi:ClpP class serine protease
MKSLWLLDENKRYLVSDEGKQEAAMYSPSDWDTSYFVTGDGIALIPIVGVLRASSSWRNSTQNIGEMLKLASADESVLGAMLWIDSPGGQASQVSQVASLIYNFAKPIHAFVVEGNSGAYWLASQARYITVADDAGMHVMGSIGAFAEIYSEAKRLENEGIDARIVRATRSTDKAQGATIEPITDKYVQNVKTQLDNLLNNYFIPDVEKGRGKKLVMEGEEPFTGLTYSAFDAVRFGLADNVGDSRSAYDKLLSKVEKKQSPQKSTNAFYWMKDNIKKLIEELTGKRIAVTQVPAVTVVDDKPKEKEPEDDSDLYLLALIENAKQSKEKLEALNASVESVVKENLSLKDKVATLEKAPIELPTAPEGKAGDFNASGQEAKPASQLGKEAELMDYAFKTLNRHVNA